MVPCSTFYPEAFILVASPILFVMGCEAHAYIAFTALMERLKDNFSTDGVTMTKKYIRSFIFVSSSDLISLF